MPHGAAEALAAQARGPAVHRGDSDARDGQGGSPRGAPTRDGGASRSGELSRSGPAHDKLRTPASSTAMKGPRYVACGFSPATLRAIRSVPRTACGTRPTCRRGSARRGARGRRSPRRCRGARRCRTGSPSASPFIRPPRNASPTPVGSTMRCGVTAGTSTRPSRVITDEPCSPRVTISASDFAEDVVLAQAGLLPQQLELVVVADHDRSRRSRRRAARRPTCARTAARDRRCSGCPASGTPRRTAPSPPDRWAR